MTITKFNALRRYLKIIPATFFAFLCFTNGAFAVTDLKPPTETTEAVETSSNAEQAKDNGEKSAEMGKSAATIKTIEEADEKIKKLSSELEILKRANEGKEEVKVSQIFKEGERGEIMLYATLSLGVSTLLLSFIGLFLASKVNGYVKRNSINKRQFQQLEAEVGELRREISSLRMQKSSERTYVAEPVEPQPRKPAPSPSLVKREVSPKVKELDPLEEFLADYRKLFTMNPMEAKEFRKNLASKYRLKGFACNNFEARMQNPSIPPIYDGAELSKAHAWAMPMADGNYAVVLKPQTYDETLHDQGSMGEIFNSNFVSGKTYKNIEVISPAVFAEGWRLVKKGELRLS